MNLTELLDIFQEIQRRAEKGEDTEHLLSELRVAWDALTNAIQNGIDHESAKQ